MNYKLFKDLSMSTLGMGNMRLPTTGRDNQIDDEKARAIIAGGAKTIRLLGLRKMQQGMPAEY